MNELLYTLSLWLVDYLIVATALLTVAAGALWRIRQPAQRMTLAWGTMAGLTVLAVATALPSWPRLDVRKWAALNSRSESESLLEPVVEIKEQVIPLPGQGQAAAPPALLPAAATNPLPLSIASSDAAATWLGWSALAWLALAAATLGWILLGAVQAWRLLSSARPSPPWAQTELARLIGRRRKPRLKTSTRIGSAVALGALRPAILLPADHVREDNRAAVQAALAHEWAHIRHGDLWLLAWQRLLFPILAAHPLFWLLRRQIRADQELLADIVAAGDRPVEYAEALLAWAKQAGPRPSAALAALAMWENPQTVSRRIQMVLDPKNPVAGVSSRWSRLVLVLGLLTVAAGLSVLSIRSRPAVAQDQPAAESPAQESDTRVQELLRENARLRKQLAELTAQIQRLRLMAVDESAEKVSDEKFMRRVYLDLLGVVPTAEDAKAFLENTDAKKREKLIDKLLADAKVADHLAKHWKEAIAGDKQPPEARDPAIVAEPAAETVSVFPLRYATAEDALKLVRDLFREVRKANANIVADPRDNSLIVQGSRQDSQTVAAILKAIDQPSAASQRGESERASADRVDGHAGYDPATQRQLLEIDLQEAENELDLAKVEHSENQKIQKTSPGALSTHDFRRKEAAVRQAELRVKRIKILLDAVAVKEKAVRSPLNAIEDGMVPPQERAGAHLEHARFAD